MWNQPLNFEILASKICFNPGFWKNIYVQQTNEVAANKSFIKSAWF